MSGPDESAHDPRHWRVGNILHDLASTPLVVGILNVTPDSFYDGGRFFVTDVAVRRGLQMMEEGAALIDVGGESTRPGAEDVAEEEQIRRVAPVVEALARRGVAVSADTRSARVASAAIQAGAVCVNDVSALSDPCMAPLVAGHDVSLVLMHAQGAPKTMQIDPCYGDVVREVAEFLADRLHRAREAGIAQERMALDVGIGFGKRPEDNLELLRRQEDFLALGRPLMIGVSRKSFLRHIAAGADPHDRLPGSLAASAIAYRAGARIFRTHDVLETVRALAAAEGILHAPRRAAGNSR